MDGGLAALEDGCEKDSVGQEAASAAGSKARTPSAMDGGLAALEDGCEEDSVGQEAASASGSKKRNIFDDLSKDFTMTAYEQYNLANGRYPGAGDKEFWDDLHSQLARNKMASSSLKAESMRKHCQGECNKRRLKAQPKSSKKMKKE